MQEKNIKNFLAKYIKDVDLEQATMKSIYLTVYSQYPGTDLSHMKDFIKSTVKKVRV